MQELGTIAVFVRIQRRSIISGQLMVESIRSNTTCGPSHKTKARLYILLLTS
jgi:hypothetical protein